MDTYLGRMLDNRYEILDEIGSGGMAFVYRARDHRLNRMVAIKILKEEYSKDADFRRRFQAESQVVAMLSHSNIVSVYDVSKADSENYIVMELIDGITLKQYMEEKGTLTWRETLHFATQIAKALEYAHSRGVVHRDIKPHNVMVLKDGSVKVTDFGIARISSAQDTLTREALGSVHYISPEQAKGGKVDYRSDLYSLGIVMYEMMTGRTPYDGDSPVSVAIQHINAKAQAPSELNPDIPKGLEQITLHAMAADLNARYPSATAMLDDMEEFRKNPELQFSFDAGVSTVLPPSEEHPVTKEDTETAENTAKRNRTKRTITIVAAVCCLLIAVSGIVYFLYTYLLKDLFSAQTDVRVPTLVGREYDKIGTDEFPDFVITVAGEEESSDFPAGYIIRQSPEADKSVKQGTSIAVTLSTGANQTIRMPELYGLSEQEAEEQLRALGIDLTVRISEIETEDPALIGRVLSYTPENNTKIEGGDTIEIQIGIAAQVSNSGSSENKNENAQPQVINPAGESAIVNPEETGEETEETVETEETEETSEPSEAEPSLEPTPIEEQAEEQPVSKIVDIVIPAGEGTAKITLCLDGEEYASVYVDLIDASVEQSFELLGNGTMTLTVYINDILVETRDVVFS